MSVAGPRLVAWEVTRRCNLRCRHCRASAEGSPYANELTREEATTLVDDLAALSQPILILTGGEPLLCPWLWDIAAYARERGLTCVLGTNGTLIDETLAQKIVDAGIRRVSVSIDFPTAAEHDRFRGVAGAFDAALSGVSALRRAGVAVQINVTVTKLNRHELPALHDLAVRLGAVALHPFLLVPTGRGADLAGAELSPAEYEDTLRWVCETAKSSPLVLKPTDAPQYQRIVRERCSADGCALPLHGAGGSLSGKGCLAGTGFCFVSHVGDVQPCGYFDLNLGNVRESSFSRIWRESPVLDDLRHPERLKGKCGVCTFKTVCGGCRARALAKTGDYLAEEPFCVHVPDRELLREVQLDFPLVERPYAELGRRLGLSESDAYARIVRLRTAGLIRRIGALFAPHRLGFQTRLVAAKVAQEHLDDVAEKVGAFSEVTHNYARRGEYNLWFTLIAQPEGRMREILSEIGALSGVKRLLELPAEKTYKLRAVFPPEAGQPSAAVPASPVTRDIATGDLIRSLSGDIIDRGLVPLANDERACVRALVADGTIRRFGAVVNHRKVGFGSNALVLWQVPRDRLDKAGAILAASTAVSHCYARQPQKDWPFNLYAMVHAQTTQEFADVIRALTSDIRSLGATGDPLILETVREYKKTSFAALVRRRKGD